MGIGLTIIGFALIATGIGAPLGVISLGAAGSIAVATVVGMGLMVAGSLLMGPAVPKLPSSLADGGRDRLHANLDVLAPRKILFGDTAGATDVRYQAFTGTDQEYLEQIVCVASHKVNSIYELWLDNELAWTSAGGVQGDFVGFLTVAPITEGTSANGIAIDSNWTVNATLTGCAYLHLKFLLLQDDGNGGNASPFGSGVTSRMTIRTKGAFVYDPRLDSTVAGGSGAHRTDTQSTWAWDANGSRNPALQLLFYLLGWRINSKLAVGMGLPAARIDLPSFITAANACDESVTKNGGGTEPRYRSDGVLTEADDRTAVVEALCSNMNAVLRDNGGKLSLYVLHNDLATPAGSFTENDVLGGLTWDQTPGINSTHNIVRGQRIDPTDEALYQPTDYAEVKLTAVDGIDRIASVNYPLCQSNGQAQRLAKQFLQRNQYQGRLSFVGKPSFWGLNLGDVFELSHVAYGWTDKLFRCAGQKINRGGETEIVAVEENAAIYQWDNDESPAVVAGTPTTYDAVANHPTQKGIGNAAKTAVVIDPVNDVIIYANSDGTIKSGELPRDVAVKASLGTANITTLGTWSRTVTSGITCTMGASTGKLNITALSALEVFVPVTFVFAGITRTATVHIVRKDDVPTTSGGGGGGSGGTTAATTTLGNTTGTSYDATNAVSETLTVTAGSAGKVQCSAPINFKRVGDVDGSTGVFGKWQWRVVAGTFADITTEVQDNFPAVNDSGNIDYPKLPGYISVTHTKTGLTPGTDYEFRFLWRRRNVSGTADNVFLSTGTLTADGTVS